MKLDQPSKVGKSEDGWESRVWLRPGGGARIRSRGRTHTMEEFMRKNGKVLTTRIVNGSLELCEIQVHRWLEAQSVADRQPSR